MAVLTSFRLFICKILICLALMFAPRLCFAQENLLFSQNALNRIEDMSFWSRVWNAIVEEFSISKNEDDMITRLFSFDFNVLFTGLRSGGIGFGAQFEQQIIPHLAGKIYFSHATFNTFYNNYYCISVTFGAFVEWYPMSQQLRKLYVGLGGYYDFLSYHNEEKNTGEGTVLSVCGNVGYKFMLPGRFILDVYAGYKYPYSVAGSIFGNTVDYLSEGVQYGIKFHRVFGFVRDVRRIYKGNKE